MALFRRKPVDPARAAVLAAFAPVGEAIEAAQRALLAAVPTFRDDGVPIQVALEGFRVHLDEADRALVTWPASPELVDRVRAALAAARRQAESLLNAGNALVFEALNARIGDVLFEFEAVADLEIELREGLRG